jgi:hypothetical protein
MSRLVAFGCSYTLGHFLPDCVEETNWKPSNLAWPKLLADKLGLECENNGERGCSNLQILHNILNFQFKEDDTVFVKWSFFDRDYLINDDGSHTQIFPNSFNTELLNHWAYTHSKRDLRVRSWCYLHHVSTYLQSLNNKFYFLLVGPDEDFYAIRPTWANNITLLDSTIKHTRDHFPRALDNSHPGIMSHRVFAYQLYAELKAKKLI